MVDCHRWRRECKLTARRRFSREQHPERRAIMIDKPLPFDEVGPSARSFAITRRRFTFTMNRGFAQSARRLNQAFAWATIQGVFCRQGDPNPHMLKILKAGRFGRRLLQPGGTGAVPSGSGSPARTSCSRRTRRRRKNTAGPRNWERSSTSMTSLTSLIWSSSGRIAGVDLLSLQPGPAARGERHHRQAGRGEVRLHARAVVGGYRQSEGEGSAAVRVAHDGGVKRAEPEFFVETATMLFRTGRGTGREIRA